MPIDLTTLKQVRTQLEELLGKMEVEADIATRATENMVFLDLTNVKPNSEILIGNNGETMLSLQLIFSLILSKKSDHDFQIVLDVDGYRQKREKSLIDLAHKVAKQVQETNKEVILNPMRPFERRIVHLTLQNEYPDLLTQSIGEDPYRKIKIMPKNYEQ